MSLSSFEGSPVPTDLATKYEKLATEYAKVRAHVGVLKKAVVEEQSRCAELREELKSKEQILRKHDQEFDSLSFRNQQLTKRVTVLQEELDHLQSAGKRGRQSKNSTDASIQDNVVMQEELEKKLIENMKLVTMLDESRTEFEQERQHWQDEVAACKKLLRNNQKQETECECDNLRRALAAAEVALLNSKERPQASISKPRISNKRVRTAVNDLPIMNLLSAVYELVHACSRLARTPPNVEEFKTDLNLFILSDQALPCLESYHSSLQRVIAVLNESHAQAMLCAIDPLLANLRRELARCRDRKLDLSEGEEAFAALIDVMRSLRSSTQYHLGVLKEVWEGRASQSPYDLVLKALSKVHKGSNAVWEFASDCVQLLHSTEANDIINFTSDVVREKPCEECNKISHNYEERILALQEKIKHMTATAESLPLLKEQVILNSGGPNNISNEFGKSAVPGEQGWPEAAVRDLILQRTSLVIEQRQAAESKLTRYVTERDAALNRMVASEDQCKDQADLIVNLQEELATTKRNYEDQLSSLSEHMANMNDKLAAQESQIEELTYEVSTKGNKKGWQK